MLHKVEVIPKATVVWMPHLFLYRAHSFHLYIAIFALDFSNQFIVYTFHMYNYGFSETTKGRSCLQYRAMPSYINIHKCNNHSIAIINKMYCFRDRIYVFPSVCKLVVKVWRGREVLLLLFAVITPQYKTMGQSKYLGILQHNH